MDIKLKTLELDRFHDIQISEVAQNRSGRTYLPLYKPSVLFLLEREAVRQISSIGGRTQRNTQLFVIAACCLRYFQVIHHV